MGKDAIVLNELSLDPSGGAAPSADALDSFAAVLAAIRGVSRGAYLVSPLQLWGEGASAHATLGPWAANPLNRDKLRQILSMQNRAPFENEFGVLDGVDLEDYTFQGEKCVGLGYAFRLELLAVSASTRDAFAFPWLELDRLSISEAAQELVTERVQARHAMAPTHVVEHREWLVLGQETSLSGTELWEHRRELFDRVDFLDRVEDDILGLEGKALRAVREKLSALQTAVAAWTPAVSPEPLWRTKVTPESQSRIDAGVCAFRDGSGTMVNYSLHARYTPGAGRIHFQFDAGRGRLVVAYVGPKLC